jgi:hypothetical protein
MPQASDIRRRAINFIRKEWGILSDLPMPLVPVVWVTVYRSLEVAMMAEAERGPRGLLKNALIGDRTLTPNLQIATVRIEMLKKAIPLIRGHQFEAAKLADARVFIDVLKWDIDPSLPVWRRVIARTFAKSDPEYNHPIPPELLADEVIE